jgi:hypothetical protein
VIGDTGTYDNDRKRQSDVYVFCLLNHRDKLTLNPLDLDQWEFYIVPTPLLDKLVPAQKKIALSFFLKNGIPPCRYSEIRSSVEQAIGNATLEKGKLQTVYSKYRKRKGGSYAFYNTGRLILLSSSVSKWRNADQKT